MRVLVTTYGSRGDVEPVAGLAAELRRLGAEVRVGAPPDEVFAQRVAAVGAEFTPVGLSAQELVTRGKVSDAPQVAAMLVRSQFDGLDPAAEGCDVLVATGLFPAAARTVAERRGMRYHLAAFTPGVFPSPHHAPLPRPGRAYPPDADNATLWDIDLENLNALYAAPLNERRAALGLAPVADLREHVYGDRPWLACDPILGPWREGPDLEVVRMGTWILPDERPLPADLREFLEAGEPPVFVGYGSMPNKDPREASRVAVEAARANGRRLVLARGWGGMGPVDDGADCFGVGEVNHQALFPRMAAIVHHGGAGTTATAARSGVPQVVVPHFADQPYWAGRVADLGIGVAHAGPVPTFASLSAALASALSPEVTRRAAETAPLIRTDGAAVAARLLMEEDG